ncbi:hypothetical protein V1283_007383 [Bradyrhizobium sp. AZCC 2262]|uniref:hypothetical protein n=1 Tax=Bradyrhizobium sp. AZCC 2262 TaxID=3117022 RepID=UPI002FF2B14E
MNFNRFPRPFLTAYDPSDLPGSSIDPLGFERGYLFLADKILPGLTNAAGRPRYFSAICAGSLLAPAGAENERSDARMRTERVLLFERFWAAANVLASEQDEELSASGIRGVTYAQAHVARLKETDGRLTDANFKMLAVQARYGAIGIYANVAGYLRLLNRSAMLPTQDSGERLGNAFLNETDAPPKLRSIIRDGEGAISVGSLREWGRRAHVAAPVGRGEGDCLEEALVRDPIRLRIVDLLKQVPPKKGEHELSRLARMQRAASRRVDYLDLKEAIGAILAFERCYRLVLLGFERVLWLCKAEGVIRAASAARDPIVVRCSDEISDAARELQNALSSGMTEEFRRDIDRLNDTKVFVNTAAAADRTSLFVEALLDRHADVQRGKFDRGRRKLPWIERKSGSYELTLSQIGEVSGEPRSIDDVHPHEYRLTVADRFIAASLGQAS